MKIIVGLGNPGEQYKNTRHNIGWLALDYWLKDVNWVHNKKFKALTYRDGNYLFVKPLTFMNESGQSIYRILNYYKLLPKKMGLISLKDSDLVDSLTVVHDELDLDFKNYKIVHNNSSAGHRGVQSIINHLKTQKFTRLRLGIRNNLLRKYIPPDEFVLKSFSREELNALPELLKEINIKNLNQK